MNGNLKVLSIHIKNFWHPTGKLQTVEYCWKRHGQLQYEDRLYLKMVTKSDHRKQRRQFKSNRSLNGRRAWENPFSSFRNRQDTGRAVPQKSEKRLQKNLIDATKTTDENKSQYWYERWYWKLAYSAKAQTQPKDWGKLWLYALWLKRQQTDNSGNYDNRQISSI